MYADVSIKSPETMRRKAPIAMVTPVGIAEGVEVDNVSVGLMVCSFTVTVDISMVVVGTLILDVVVILGSVTKEPKFQQKLQCYRSNLYTQCQVGRDHYILHSCGLRS